eukprot:2659684-Prymnesium_polylepis.1
MQCRDDRAWRSAGAGAPWRSHARSRSSCCSSIATASCGHPRRRRPALWPRGSSAARRRQ